jgi:undecaprenyl-diphosphatase
MDQLFQIIVLGIVEGITEFLPISSTGHLLILQAFPEYFARRSDAFNVVIQLGAIMAVVVIYWRKLVEMFTQWREPENFDMLLKLIVSFGVTGALGVAAKIGGLHLPEEVAPVAWALIVGALVIFVAEHRLKGKRGSDDITWTIALAVGAAQMLAAVFPGTSRSGASIFAAMLLGVSRIKSTEFSFLVGIPTMFAASGLELVSLIRKQGLATSELDDIAIGFVVSAAVAFVVVKWLLQFVQTHSFVPFAWYRLVLGIGLLAYFGYLHTGPPPTLEDGPANAESEEGMAWARPPASPVQIMPWRG